ncbi:hypothetical protein GCM10014713_53910 [Streptomyces purpureus]|uniref:Uncharacterized protein n=1 Tax=Streptomyces purpureus TaxID=1951 RepID=A0A918HCH1_9ACTN|nr:hypothetical protein GCM10014713_53910 [Streptomyces purpureus]
MSTRYSVRLPDPPALEHLAVSTWIDAGLVPRACMLIAYDPLAGGASPRDPLRLLLGLARGLGLSSGREPATQVGGLVSVSDAAVALDYGHPEYLMTVPWPGPRWRELSRVTRRVHIALGLDPLPAGSGMDEISAYLARTSATGRLWRGTGVVHSPRPSIGRNR